FLRLHHFTVSLESRRSRNLSSLQPSSLYSLCRLHRFFNHHSPLVATFDLQSAANANSKFPTTSLSHSVDLQPSAFRRFPTLFTSLSAAVELQPATLCGSESTLVGSQHPATSLPHSRLCRSPAVQPSFFGLPPILHSPPEHGSSIRLVKLRLHINLI
ncbi:hypothetical protein LINPERHAP2_LOCUS37580, partial [Linum perenne]